jgi:rubrerythrin
MVAIESGKGLGYRCNSCGALLSKRYSDPLCPECRKSQEAQDEEMRIAIRGA